VSEWGDLSILALSVALVNVPFGYWRAGTRKFTPQWFVAVHAPVPLVVVLRLAAGIALRLGTATVLVGAFFGGQVVGGKLHAWRRRAG
jgi:uncharacterized membrane protein YphA (DoxX/SURF4 family)